MAFSHVSTDSVRESVLVVRESVLVVGPVLTSLITLCDTLNLETHRLHYNNITILIIVNKNMHIYIYIYMYAYLQ